MNKDLNISRPDEPQIESEPIEERPRWMPKPTMNRYFKNPSMIESISERPKTKYEIKHKENVVKKRRAKNKLAKKARRKNRK